MHEFHKLKISEIRNETPNAISVTFEIPEHLKDTFSFKAGQYITIKHDIAGNEVRRAYSICTSPASGILKVGIKKVPQGTFSLYANTKLQVGDMLMVMPPQGTFTIPDNSSNNPHYVAFAAGSGITPILSIITTILESKPDSTFSLAYGNRSVQETMFHKDLLKLLQKYPDRFFIEFIYSRKQEGKALFGRIERSTVNYFLKNRIGEKSITDFFLCGPESMINEVSDVLKDQGYEEKHIHFELFTTEDEGTLVEPHDGVTTLTVTLDDETTTFVMPQNTSVLDAVLKEGLDPPYSCQGGICSTCIARILSGKAEMQKNQILTDGEIAEGFVLTCQAHPTTSTLEIDYDDI